MCGICGIIDRNASTEENKAVVWRMVSKLQHRRPDYQAVQCLGPATLGHARLASIDLASVANQPVRSHDGRYILVYSGEIYNSKELRNNLAAKGVYPQSQSDNEVLLLLWEKYGKDCLLMLNGMFAFAVWDTHLSYLTLVRDRFGQKPLYYAERNKGFSFASELRALMCDPNIERKADPKALFHYLTVQSVPAPLCAFAGVNKLAPGYFLEWDGTHVQTKPYWTPHFSHSFCGTEEEATEELDLRLREAVRTRLISDVPVGVFLSGGVDSSLITALACQSSGTPMSTFAMGVTEGGFDERPYARQVSNIYGTQHHDELVSPNILALIPELVRQYGEPFADSSAIATWYLARMTKQHVTVALSGDGGDELFGGYERYLSPYLFAQNIPDEVASLHLQLASILESSSVSKDLFPMLSPATSKYYAHWSRIREPLKNTLCGPFFCEETCSYLSLGLMLQHFSRHAQSTELDRIQAFELEYYLACTLTTKVDMAAMHFSLEVRAPILDNAVADFAMSLPESLRVACSEHVSGGSLGNGFEPKALLKKVACRYLPASLVYRRKQGFGVPIGQWLRRDLRSWMCDTLLSKTCAERGWIDPSSVRHLVEEHLSEKYNHQHALWALLMLEEWALYCLDNPES